MQINSSNLEWLLIYSSSCCNFDLKRTSLDNSDVTNTDVVETIRNNVYFGDCLKSVASEEEAVALVKDLSSTLQNGRFKIGKWMSNIIVARTRGRACN